MIDEWLSGLVISSGARVSDKHATIAGILAGNGARVSIFKETM
jgi:hypothetical protein